MKNIVMKFNILFLFGLVLVFSNCIRDFFEEVKFVIFLVNGDVYIDGFSLGLEYLFFGDFYFEVFFVDEQIVYEGEFVM